MRTDRRARPTRGKAGRAGRSLAAVAVLVLLAAAPAWAVCGDGIIDPGELCDDGNLADGDCCTSTCQRPTGCYATDHSAILIRDQGDDRSDRVSWRYYRGPTTFEDWGNPTDDTYYAFCIWDDDELKVDTTIEPGGICHPRRPCWSVVGRGEPQGYQYFDKPANDWGIQRLLVSTQQSPAYSYISLRGFDVNLPLPGPVAFDRYFNAQTAVTVQFLRSDSPICWEATFPNALRNFHKRFKAFLH